MLHFPTRFNVLNQLIVNPKPFRTYLKQIPLNLNISCLQLQY